MNANKVVVAPPPPHQPSSTNRSHFSPIQHQISLSFPGFLIPSSPNLTMVSEHQAAEALADQSVSDPTRGFLPATQIQPPQDRTDPVLPRSDESLLPANHMAIQTSPKSPRIAGLPPESGVEAVVPSLAQAMAIDHQLILAAGASDPIKSPMGKELPGTTR